MTILGPDLSSFEHGVNVAALPDTFVLAKCTEGTFYTDADYAAWRAQAAVSGKVFVAYHFISGEDPDAQAAHLAAHIGDASLPVMIDWEDEGSFKPTLPQLLALADAMARHRLRPRLAYAPRWHWAEVGSPSLSGLTSRDLGLVSSNYPGGTSYPGDSGPGWAPYGGVTPMLWQYTDAAVEGGQRVGDMNAYRGTIGQLAAFLGSGAAAPTPTPTPGGAMGTISPNIGVKWPEIAGQFPANASFDNDTALIWSDAGARAAALYAQQARDASNGAIGRLDALSAKVDALSARVGTPVPAVVDVNALAVALAPHLTAGATAEQIAHAVVAHLGADLAAG